MKKLPENYFEIFGLPIQFDVSESELEEKYRTLQATYHPDRFSAAEESEKLLAVQQSSLLNQAFETLRTPLARAGYILQLQGLDIAHASQEELGMELLIQQMELRESLGDLPVSEDSLVAIDGLKKDVSSRFAAARDVLANSIAAADWPRAKRGYHELQFLQKMLEEIDAAEEKRLGY